ncbi:hypothetical protein R1flu_020440 [Riccia fluitans]|uniref:Initiator tRNA phosphoribosyl transferase family protein n=1 Tax=Riccia fluitans TaxID=41844 RepID=A0ABD1ZMP4_9MARC
MAEDINPPGVENIYKVTRKIKKTEQTLYNALRSIHDDSMFVSEIRSLWRELPLLANLRCGFWYSSEFDGTCYFKSTDGHNGNWSFNTGRLNLHVLQLAAERRGCFIVDATRKGKRFPDAMSKTIPIWACVMNRALADYRTLHAQEMLQSTAIHQKSGACGTAEHCEGNREGGIFAVAEEEWDCSLHLPSWISHVEKGNIQSRLEGWVQSLKSVSIDFEQLSNQVKKPLRPLWISQNSVIWLNELPELDDWPFTPIILVSASKPSVFTQRYTDADFSWSYIPGAADDEESWARGLTPALFWKHQREILEGGPASCNSKVADIVERDRVYRALRGNVTLQVCVKTAARGGGGGSSNKLDPRLADIRSSKHQETSDLELQDDQSSVSSEGGPVSSSAFRVVPSNLKGFHWIGNSGLAVGNDNCGSRDDIYGVVDSLINCGASSNPASICQKETYLYLPIVGPKFDRYSLQNHLAEAISFALQKLSNRQTVLIYCSSGEDISVCVCLAILLSCHKGRGGGFESLDKLCPLTKSDVRQELIYLSSFNSDARPSRGSLRQVFNFFNASLER